MSQKILFVSATEYAVEHFAAPYIDWLSNNDYSVHVLTGSQIGHYVAPLGVTTATIGLERKPNPLSDAKQLAELVKYMRRHDFDVVYSISPKGGLIAQLAAKIAGVPHRIHFVTGQTWKTKEGAEREMLKRLDQLMNAVCTSSYIDSASQAEFLIDEGVLSRSKAKVLGSGSVSGIVIDEFLFSEANRQIVRGRHGFKDDEIVVFFLGRISPVKGVTDLVRAFAKASAKNEKLRLLIVGPDDGDLPEVKRLIQRHKLESLVKSEFESTPRPAIHYSAAEVYCVPSYMEGFGNVVLEAACAGVPTIGSDIYGLQDSIADGHSGLLFPCGDIDALAATILELANDHELRKKLGVQAANRVREEFSQEHLVDEFRREHESLLVAKK